MNIVGTGSWCPGLENHEAWSSRLSRCCMRGDKSGPAPSPFSCDPKVGQPPCPQNTHPLNTAKGGASSSVALFKVERVGHPAGLVSTISFSGFARMDYSLFGNNMLKGHSQAAIVQ